jgi:hypothetical protein
MESQGSPTNGVLAQARPKALCIYMSHTHIMAVNTASDLVVGQILLLIRSLQLLIFYLYKLFFIILYQSQTDKPQSVTQGTACCLALCRCHIAASSCFLHTTLSLRTQFQTQYNWLQVWQHDNLAPPTRHWQAGIRRKPARFTARLLSLSRTQPRSAA